VYYPSCEQPVDANFDRRADFGPRDPYSATTVDWAWQNEVLPLASSGVPPQFVLWQRADVSGLAPYSYWSLIDGSDPSCQAHGGTVDCDEYGNAFSVATVEPRITYLPIFGEPEEEGMGGPGPAFPDLGGGGDPPFLRLTDILGPYLKAVGFSDPPFGKFANYNPASATQGLLFDQVTVQGGFVSGGRGIPSVMAPNEAAIDVVDFALAFVTPAMGIGRESALSGAGGGPPPTGGLFFLFGGTSPDGSFSNALWRGELVTDKTGGTSLVWRRETYSSWFPPGLIGSALVPVEGGERVAVLGGFTELGSHPVSGGWIFERPSGRWLRVGISGATQLQSAWMGVAWSADVAYFYGGWDGAAFRDGLFRWDPAHDWMVRLDELGAETPGPRSGPSLAVSGDGQRLVLYGGSTPTGATNDLWSYDFQARSWRRLAPACSKGQCPAPGRAGLYVEPGSSRVLVIPAALDVQKELYWIHDGVGWTSADGYLGHAKADDCDGDGAAEANAGFACRTGDRWWAEVGENECDSETGALVCDAPEGDERHIEILDAGPLRRYAVNGAAGYVLDDRRLEPVDLSNPRYPAWAPSIRLGGRGREIAVHGSALVVATSAGVETFDLSEPLRPRRLLDWRITFGVDDLIVVGTKVVLVQPEAVTTADFADAAHPRVLATHRVVRILPGIWRLDPEGRWPDILGRILPGRRVGAYDGRWLVLGDRFDLAVLEMSADGRIARVVDSEVALRLAGGVRMGGNLGYTEDLLGSGTVFRVTEAGIDEFGRHELDGWVDRIVYGAGRAYRTTTCGIEVAYHD
jgi:hypothetical protein